MKNYQPTIVITSQTPSTLGEGPAWWDSLKLLTSVDIPNGLVKHFDPNTGAEDIVELGGELSAVIPRRGGGMVAAIGHEIRAYSAAGNVDRIWEVESDLPLNRLNDCRSDSAGRLWAGTMSKDRSPDSAALYRVDQFGVLSTQIAPTTLSNGLGWNRHNSLMYFIDSTTHQIDVLNYNIETGEASNRRLFAKLDPAGGLPDGLTVDSDGGVWVALFGGSAVRRYASSGAITHHIALPVTNPTCPAFGGADMNTLFITSARIKLSDEQLSSEPAGALLAIPDLEFQGFSANECVL